MLRDVNERTSSVILSYTNLAKGSGIDAPILNTPRGAPHGSADQPPILLRSCCTVLGPGRAEGLDTGPLAHRSLEVQLEAAAGGRPDGLLGVVAEVVAHQPATGRCKREGARTSRHPPVGQRRAWPRSTRRAGTWVAAARSLCVQAVCGLCACRATPGARVDSGWSQSRCGRGGGVLRGI